jgi:hypothetical protein
MMDLTVAFRNFAKAPNKNKRDRQYTHTRNMEVVSRNLFAVDEKEQLHVPIVCP